MPMRTAPETYKTRQGGCTKRKGAETRESSFTQIATTRVHHRTYEKSGENSQRDMMSQLFGLSVLVLTLARFCAGDNTTNTSTGMV